MKRIIHKTLALCGYKVIKQGDNHLHEYNEFIDIYEACQPFTMTSIERMYALYKSIEYIIKNNIPGDFVECGVWRGGSSMIIAKSLLKFGCTDRKIYLYDTFEGMSEPTEKDVTHTGFLAKTLLKTTKKSFNPNIWCYANIEDVQKNMQATGYPLSNIQYIKGKVEDTLVNVDISQKIALLRLDTDWYESTKIEVAILYPLLVKNGVLIIDDYGHWQGARQAVDEFIEQQQHPILLNRIDYTGRLSIKLE